MFKSILSLRVIRVLMASIIVAAVQVTPAAAALTTVGDLPTTGAPYISTKSQTGIFSDSFVFRLIETADMSASLASLELDSGPFSIFNIDNLHFELYSFVGGVATSLLSSGASELGFDNLASGDYLIRVSGNANGLSGGQYLFGLAATVPEPEQWMLFGTALLAMGGIARRRSS